MMKKILLVSSIFLISLTSLAYVPSVESLFRNGNNGDIDKKTVAASFIVERITPLVADAEFSSDSSEEGAMELPRMQANENTALAYKIIVFNENEERPKAVQLSYKGTSFSKKDMNSISFANSLSLKGFKLLNTSVESKAFYAAMISLVNNNSRLMIEFIKSISPDVNTNKELADKELIYWLGEYKKYLIRQGQLEEKNKENNGQLDAQMTEPLINPLKPEDPEMKTKIKEILKRPFISESTYIKRVRENKKFYWDVVAQNFYARFDNDNHRLLNMKIFTDPEHPIEFEFKNYILFSSNLEFPEIIYIKDSQGIEYRVVMKKLYSFKDSLEVFSRRLKRYFKELKENERVELTNKPHFML